MVRAAISESHQQIELTPFSKGMMDGSISRSEYANGLVQLWHIHDELESLVQQAVEVSNYFTSEMVRTNTITRDLRAFGCKVVTFQPMSETLAMSALDPRYRELLEKLDGLDGIEHIEM
jgi:heme oxygenase